MEPDSLRVAVVTDNAALEDLIRRDLSEFTVSVARLPSSPSGGVGAQELDLRSCDICLLDREGDGWDAFDVLKEVKKDRPDAPPIVLLGGKGDRDEDIEAMALGAAGYLSKSGITAELLERTIRYADQCGRRSRMLARQSASMTSTHAALESLLDAAPVLVARIDREGRYEYVNAVYSEWMDTPHEDVIGHPVRDMIPASMWEAVRTHMDSALAGVEETFELAIPSRDSSTMNGRRYVSVACTPQYDGDGDPGGFVVGATDVTNRRAMESDLRKLSDALDQIEDMVVITDTQGVIEYTNAAFERQTGYSRADTIGHTPRLQKSDRHGSEFYEELWQTLLAGRVFQAEFINRRKDGSLYYEEKVITPIRNETGAITHFASTGRDITERRETERSLFETNQRLEEALRELKERQEHTDRHERLRALGRMASGIAHDLNNALSPILGFSELLLTKPGIEATKAERYLNMIHTAAEGAQGTVLQLREFYRPREDRDLRPVDLSQVIAKVISLTQPRWKDEALVRGKTITIHTDVAAVPPVAANDAELRDALTNLVLNACDAMPEGGDIYISLSQTPSQSDERDGFAVLEVRDTGVGMPEDVRRKCVEPFFTTKGVGGTGMGLAMVYGTMDRYDGRLEIESEPGLGTIMRLRFPLSDEQRAEDIGRDTVPLIEPLHVLLVDDDPVVQAVIAEYLLADAHVVTKADNGLEGIILSQQEDFDLIITDRAMPEMSGDQFAERLRAEEIATPVIMLTGYGAMMDSPPEGVTSVVAKPVTVAELRAAIACAVGLDS